MVRVKIFIYTSLNSKWNLEFYFEKIVGRTKIMDLQSILICIQVQCATKIWIDTLAIR